MRSPRLPFAFFIFHFLIFIGIVCFATPHGANADEPLAIGPFGDDLVWPITGTSTPDKIAYTFGPRRFKMEQRYDFNRGIDLLAPEGTEVHAVADGEVRIAGKYLTYAQPAVQLRHVKPGNEKQVYFSQYMWLADATVKEGDQVKKGQIIGHTGRSPNGYERTHFELRDGKAPQAFAVHPLAALPYENKTAPRVNIHNVTAGKIHSTVELTIEVPSDEVDFVRLELDVAIAGAAPQTFVYDMNEWNRTKVAVKTADKTADPLDQIELDGIEFAPDYFQASSEHYRLDLRFFELPPAANATAIKVSARAIDARGKIGEAKRPK